MTFRDSMTLGEARALLLSLIDEGVLCPCCGQNAEVYKRKIHTTLAKALITLYRHSAPGQFVHTASLPGDTHEISQLSWWGLIEEELIRRPDGGRAGWWRIVPPGVNWVMARTTVPKYARVYDGTCLSLTGEPVTIRDALGTKFNYRELMEGI